jgi:hypothetical protein
MIDTRTVTCRGQGVRLHLSVMYFKIIDIQRFH